MKNRNTNSLVSFTAYCRKHPGQRFWQALRNWSKNPFILASSHFDSEMFDQNFMPEHMVAIYDTFYW
jgi:hypothetical protein